MTIQAESRNSDSPYIESVMRGMTLAQASPIRPAECHWHMVFVQHAGEQRAILVGPWSSAGVTSYGAEAQILWVKFKLGTFMPHWPTRKLLDSETVLPEAAVRQSFWLKSSAWQAPDFEDVETFVDRLVRTEILVCDPLVQDVLQGQRALPGSAHAQNFGQLASRTVRHRFLQATGLSHSQIRQYERARQAAGLLENGVPILDAVFEAGYYDQPHLTRALKHWVGRTPAQINLTARH